MKKIFTLFVTLVIAAIVSNNANAQICWGNNTAWSSGYYYGSNLTACSNTQINTTAASTQYHQWDGVFGQNLTFTLSGGWASSNTVWTYYEVVSGSWRVQQTGTGQTANITVNNTSPIGNGWNLITFYNNSACPTSGGTTGTSATLTYRMNATASPTISVSSNITQCEGSVTNYSATASPCGYPVNRILGPASGTTFPLGLTNVKHQLSYARGDGGYFTYPEGASNQEIAKAAAESLWGVGNALVGTCGSFTYYYRNGSTSCDCNKAIGELEFIYNNSGYSQIGQDYGGGVTNAPIISANSRTGQGPYVRRKAGNGCSTFSWTMAQPDLRSYGGQSASFTVKVNKNTFLAPLTGTQTVCTGSTTTFAEPLPTGGNITSSGGYRIHTFTSSGTFAVPAGFSGNVQVLVVGGGGGGGMDMGGGGGGGAVVNATVNVTGNVPVTVGAGGAGGPAANTSGQPGGHQYTIRATNGGTSSFGGVTAAGGGYGASSYWGYTPDFGQGGTGASGGGASGYSDGTFGGRGGAATAGFPGGGGGGQYYSGGGGGAGGPGAQGPFQPNGGPGLSSDITGTLLYYGGGGGGAGYSACGGNGGIGGGGGGAVCSTVGGGSALNSGSGGGGGSINSQTNTPGGNGGANTGGGGGGGSHYNANNKGGNGGSGVVIVRYPEITTGTWSTSNAGVASVNSSGVVTGVSAGTATITYTVNNTVGCTGASVSRTVTVNQTSSAPTAISGGGTICPTASATLSIVGGSLGTGATWRWYAGGCGSGSSIGSGTSITVTPGSTTTYFARAEGTCNTTACASTTVTVSDVTAPAITCPANINVNATAGTCGAVVIYTAPTGTDACPGVGGTTQIAGLASGSTFPVGVTTNTFRVIDFSGNSTTCSFTVTVTDNQAPTIICPANINVNAAAGTCAATVTYTTPTGADNCPGATVTRIAGPASGSSFPVGTTTVTHRVTAANGATADCSFTVTVTDNQAPTIICPANINVNAAAGTCAATVTYTTPTGADNCPGATVTRIAGPASGSSFPVGTTTVTHRVTAANGATADCSFTVTVTDNQAPTIICPANINVNAAAGTCAATVTYTTPTGADNCPGATVTRIAGPASGSSFPVGTTTVTHRVTAANGATADCSFTVTVTDNQAPTISCPANINVNAAAGTCAATVTYTTPTGADNCPGATVTRIAGPASGSSFPVGTTTVTHRVTAANGATADCSFTVTVTDNQAPTIICPANINVNAAAGTCAATVTYTTPTGADNCPGATVTRIAGPASGSSFPLGTTTVTHRVTAANGATADCSFTVTVTDNQNPTITAPAAVNATTNTGCTATGVSLGTAATADNCSVASVTNNAPTAFPLGGTVVTWTVTDGSGRTATATQLVTVTDNVNPTITAPAAVNATTNTGCTATGVSLGTAATADNCSVASVTNNAPTAFPLGGTVVTWTVTDGSGRTATATQLVTVTDNVNPTITAPAAVNATTNTGCTATGVLLGTPTTADNCSVASVTNNAPTAFPLGGTVVTWTVTDGSGRTATATQLVTVTDNVNPTVTAPSAVTVSTDAGSCAATGVALGTPATADNCSVASVTNNAPTSFPKGNTIVTWTVTDGSGNTATATQTVTVNDTEAPAITCPANITVNSQIGRCGAIVNYTAPVGTDNCPGAVTTRIDGFSSGSVFRSGITTNTFMVTDASGNTTTCSFTITVIDIEAPTVTCAPNITLNADPGSCEADPNYCLPQAGFAGAFATSNWSLVNTAGGSGSVDLTDAPDEIVLSGSDNGSATLTSTNYQITVPCNGTISFSWIYNTADMNSAYDPFGYMLNGVFTQVVANGLSSTQVGTTTVPVSAGDVFGFSIFTIDNLFGASATIVSSFSASSPLSVVAQDNCGIQSIIPSVSGPFPVGNTPITWTVTDFTGNTATCVQNVTVIDNQPPTISVPGPVAATTNTACTATGVTLGTATTTDNCPGATVSNNAPAAFPLGATTVIWTATDASGNTTTGTQVVTVTDNVNPTITAPAAVVVSTDAGSCAATSVALGTPVTADNCSVANVTNNALSSYPKGTTTVTWIVTDGSGNTASATQIVTVNDTENPTITVPANIAVANDNGVCGATVTYAVSSTDNCPGQTVAQTAGLASVSVFPVGTTTNTFEVTDASGNKATQSFTVTVSR
jgi:phosphatidylethanolamine-binding protein (PEBP) family uncharacterized protein